MYVLTNMSLSSPAVFSFLVAKCYVYCRQKLSNCKSAPETMKETAKCGPPSAEIEEMSINEIVNGNVLLILQYVIRKRGWFSWTYTPHQAIFG